MAQKIHFSLLIANASDTDRFEFKGAAARNVLQVIHGPDLRVVRVSNDCVRPYALMDRDFVTTSTQGAVIGKDLPETQICSNTDTSPPGGLYVHSSVTLRLEQDLKRMYETDHRFRTNYGFSAPAPLMDAVEMLHEFFKNWADPASPYDGLIHW